MALRGYNDLMLMGTKPWESFLRTVVTITTTATAIPTTALSFRKGIWLFNIGTTNCFIALSADIGTSNEVTLYASQSLVIPATDNLTVYGRVASSTATVVAWEYV